MQGYHSDVFCLGMKLANDVMGVICERAFAHIILRYVGSGLCMNTYHGKAVTNPDSPPSPWTVRHLSGLTVYCYYIGWSVTYDTARNVLGDLSLRDWHHGDGSCCGEPEGLVVSTGIVTYIVKVTEDEGHCTEAL